MDEVYQKSIFSGCCKKENQMCPKKSRDNCFTFSHLWSVATHLFAAFTTLRDLNTLLANCSVWLHLQYTIFRLSLSSSSPSWISPYTCALYTVSTLHMPPRQLQLPFPPPSSSVCNKWGTSSSWTEVGLGRRREVVKGGNGDERELARGDTVWMANKQSEKSKGGKGEQAGMMGAIIPFPFCLAPW